MRQVVLTAVALALFASTSAHAGSQVFSQAGSKPSIKGPEANFTGSVIIDPLYGDNEHTSNTGGLVTFSPGARSAWHMHPAGQVLIISSGTGWVKEEGGQKLVVRAGDVIWTPPGVKHWHGASADNGMSHIAITNMKDGEGVDWLEKVSDGEYLD